MVQLTRQSVLLVAKVARLVVFDGGIVIPAGAELNGWERCRCLLL